MLMHNAANASTTLSSAFLLLLAVSALFFTSAEAQSPPLQVITAPSPSPDDFFGGASNTDGTRLITGATGDDAAGTNTGAAYVYVRSGTSWVLEDKLEPPSFLPPGSELGAPTSISGNYAFVAARPYQSRTGIVIVYQRNGSDWAFLQAIQPAEAQPDWNFGSHLRADGDRVVIGSDQRFLDSEPGRAYVYVRSGSTWIQEDVLTASDGAAGDQFGFTTDIEGSSLIIAAQGDDGARGAAYVFTRSGSTWSQQAKLTASDREPEDRPRSVAISNGWAMMGASMEDSQGLNAGKVYTYERIGTTWVERAALTGSTPGTERRFGTSLAMDGTRAVIGAPSNGANAAYIFDRSGNTWTERARVDNLGLDGLGGSTGLSGTTAVVGANEANGNRGALVIFDLSDPEPITITSPQPGDTYTAGSTLDIRWNRGDVPAGASLTLRLRPVGGGLTVISSGTPNDGVFDWDIPSSQMEGDYRVEIAYTDAGGGSAVATSGVFSIGANPILVTSPTQGDVLTAGSMVQITWDPGSVPPNESLFINLRRPGQPLERTVRNVPNSGNYEWNIRPDQTPASDYFIEIAFRDASDMIVKTQSGSFEIEPPSNDPLVVTSPMEGDVLTAGSTTQITWDVGSVPTSAEVFISLRLLGEPIQRIARRLPNSGSYTWDIPTSQAAGTDYFVLLSYRAADGTLVRSTSGRFEIVAPPLTFAASTLAAEEPLSLTPSPVRTAGTVSFTVPSLGQIQLAVFDMQGREVARLAEGTYMPGTHRAQWDATSFATGTYVIRLISEDGAITRTLSVVR